MKLAQRFGAFLLTLLLATASYGQLALTGAGPGVLGGGGGDPCASYQLCDFFSGSSRDTSKWASTTVAPGWSSSTTIGGSETETGGVVTVTPTASADRIEGRSSATTTHDLSSQIMCVHKSAPSTVRHKSTFGYSHGANRTAMNIRFELEYAFGSGTISAVFSNFGGGTPWSATYSATDHAWWCIEDASSDIVWYTAPDSGGSPGTLVERRRLSTSGGSYFSPNSGDVGFWVQNYNSEASAINVGWSAFWLTQ